MFCPNCDEDATFTAHTATVCGSLGLSYDEDWGMDHYAETYVQCGACGSRMSEQELEAYNYRATEANDG